MAPPIIKIPSKKGKALPPPEDEDYEDDDEDLNTVEVMARSLVPTTVRSRAPSIIVPPPGTLTDKEVAQEIEDAIARQSSFGYSLDHIRTHIANKDYAAASMTTKEAILSTLIELVPLAEVSLRKSGASKGIYQFNSLIGQVREMLVDLDGERDMANTMQSILDESIHPMFKQLVQMILLFTNGLKRGVRTELQGNEGLANLVNGVVDEHVKELASYIQGMYSEIQKRVEKKVSET